MQRGNLVLAKLLLEKGSKIHKKTLLGFTPLGLAVEAGNIELIKLLLKIKKWIYAEDHNSSVFSIAIHTKRSDILWELIQNAKDSGYVKSIFTEDILSFAIENGGPFTIEIIDFLFSHQWINEPLENYLNRAATHGNMELINYIYNHTSPDVNEQNYKGFTPLMRAAFRGFLKTCELLIQRSQNISKPVNINLQTPNGLTALSLAIYSGDVRVVELLLKQPNINKTLTLNASFYSYDPYPFLLFEKGDTALHIAAKRGSLPIVEALLAAGFDGNTLNQKGLSPLYYAAIQNNTAIVDILTQQGVDYSSLSTPYTPSMKKNHRIEKIGRLNYF